MNNHTEDFHFPPNNLSVHKYPSHMISDFFKPFNSIITSLDNQAIIQI